MSSTPKRKTYKVSASLINSYLNMKNEKYNDSKESFINQLKRIPLKINYVLKRGNAFEKAVTTYRNEPFYSIVTKCDKQFFVQKEIPMENEDFDLKLVGYIDFISKDRKIIYDTKRVNNWDDAKYDNSVQHNFYLWAVPESEQFYYLVGVGTDWVSDKYFEVKYGKPLPENLENKCLDVINEFITYLKNNDLLEIYQQYYDDEYNNKKKGEGN